MAAGEHGDGAGLERGDMGALVDPAREAGDDDIARLAEAAREPVGESKAGGRSVARADDGDRTAAARLPRGRATRAAAARRRYAAARADIPARKGDEADAEPASESSISRSISSTPATRIGRPAPPRRARSGSAASAAAAPPQRSSSARKVRGPTFSLADQPQPIETLVVAEPRSTSRAAMVHPFLPILVSVPASRRAMLALWRIHSSAASAREDDRRRRVAQRQRGERRRDARRQRRRRRIAGHGRRRPSQTSANTSAAGRPDKWPIKPPRKVATPLPPRKRSQTGIEMAEEGAGRAGERRLASPNRHTASERPPPSPSARRGPASRRRGPCGRCAARWSRRCCPSRSLADRRRRRSASGSARTGSSRTDSRATRA